MRIVAMVLAALLTVQQALAAPVMTPDGLGLLHVGMRWHQAERAIGHKIDLNPIASDDLAICAEAAIVGMPGVMLLLERYRIRAITVDRSFATVDGVGIGTSEEDLRHIFGTRARFDFRPYAGGEAGAHNVIVRLGGEREYLFQTRSGKVDLISIGDRPAVEYWEGCA